MKIFVDVETTGFDPWRDSILSLSTIITDDKGNEIARFNEFCRFIEKRIITRYFYENGKMKEWKQDLWSEKAEAVHGLSLDFVMQQQHPIHLFVNWINFLGKYIDKPTPLTMFTKNMAFDLRMITGFFNRVVDYHYFKMYRYVDHANWENVADYLPSDLANTEKLEDIAAKLGIEHNAHESMSDTEVTLELWQRYAA